MGFIDATEEETKTEESRQAVRGRAGNRRISFGDVKPGMTGRVVAVRSSSPEAIRLQEMGLSIGAEFTVLELAPFGDPVQISLRGYRLCLRRREARAVDVEVLEEASGWRRC
jgi:ferrous iron transport protein A